MALVRTGQRIGVRAALRRRLERGASMVEFAIVLPFFALLLLGMIDFGLALHSRGLVGNAAREAARLGAVGATPTAMETHARGVAGSLDQSDLTITVTCTKPDSSPCSFSPSNIAPGNAVVVRVDYDYGLLSPLVFAPSVRVSSTAHMRYEG